MFKLIELADGSYLAFGAGMTVGVEEVITVAGEYRWQVRVRWQGTDGLNAAKVVSRSPDEESARHLLGVLVEELQGNGPLVTLR